jgi:hypothetical protein
MLKCAELIEKRSPDFKIWPSRVEEFESFVETPIVPLFVGRECLGSLTSS